MGKKLYVGNLSYSVTGDKLRELFAPYGELEEVTVISFKDTGKSKGFGFVTIKDEAQAEKAIAEMNGKEFDGRKMTVNEAKPMEPRDRDDRRGPPRRSFSQRRY